MIEPLQDFHFKSNRYERPGCEWICGRTSEGAACQLGPNRKGVCNTINTCQPELVGDEYRCTRSKLNGGPCEEGAFPDGRCSQKDERCQPVRSIRSRRRLVTVWLSALVFGFCIWLFGSASPSDLISPGELTFPHRGASQDCSSCHTAAEGDEQHWIMSAFHSNIAIDDSNKCLVCHKDLGTNSLHAHGLSPQRLASLTSIQQQNPGASNGTYLSDLFSHGKLHDSQAEWACATCHHEHRGIDHNLKAMSNDRCVSCHTRKFEHFGEGHPEFTDFPYVRRTRIYFDHNRHFMSYFAEAEKSGNGTISCSTCHQPDGSKQTFSTAGFEQSCAKCHESQIIDADFPGVPFLQLPALDFPIFSEKKIDVGEWPSVGTAKRMSELPPFMKMLLESDPNYRDAMKNLGEFDFRDIDSLAESKPESVAKLLWSIKKLFLDVATNGQKELEKRLGHQQFANALDTKVSFVDVMVASQKKWFPSLSTEYQAFQDKTLDVMASKTLMSENEIAMGQNNVGWYRTDEDLSIRFRPKGHADRFLKNWFELSVALPIDTKSNSLTQFQRMFESPSASGSSVTQGPVASGRCLLCHTVDRYENGRQLVNWFAQRPTRVQKGLNKFSHAPHITSGESTCASCHRWESTSVESVYREAFGKFDLLSLEWKIESNCTIPNTSGFAPLNQAKCATCHKGQATGDNCLKCHNYHHR